MTAGGADGVRRQPLIGVLPFQTDPDYNPYLATLVAADREAGRREAAVEDQQYIELAGETAGNRQHKQQNQRTGTITHFAATNEPSNG